MGGEVIRLNHYGQQCLRSCLYTAHALQLMSVSSCATNVMSFHWSDSSSICRLLVFQNTERDLANFHLLCSIALGTALPALAFEPQLGCMQHV